MRWLRPRGETHFFAEELAAHLVDSGLASGDGGRLPVDLSSIGVPERVRQTVGRRLLSIPPEACELLLVGSVIGLEFPLALAGSATRSAGAPGGLLGSVLVDAADDSLLAGLVVQTSPGRLAFRHVLVQAAVKALLSPPARLRSIDG